MKYYFKTDSKAKYMCIEQCPIKDVRIGSNACAECRHNKNYNPIKQTVDCNYLTNETGLYR